MSDTRIEKFVDANELSRSGRTGKQRIPWPERVKMIREEFPSVVDIDWVDAMTDPLAPEEANDVMIRILEDILQVDQMVPGRRGGRPAPDYERGMQTFREIMRRDFSDLPFCMAFKLLAGSDSATQMARKTGISRSRIHRLVVGSQLPMVEDMRACAKAYGRKPAYFLEYRKEFVLAALASRLEEQPELVTVAYTKIVGLL